MLESFIRKKNMRIIFCCCCGIGKLFASDKITFQKKKLLLLLLLYYLIKRKIIKENDEVIISNQKKEGFILEKKNFCFNLHIVYFENL